MTQQPQNFAHQEMIVEASFQYEYSPRQFIGSPGGARLTFLYRVSQFIPCDILT